ncbi:MAG: serine/threonine-protein kinase, partial [Planctomycetota bacterium]
MAVTTTESFLQLLAKSQLLDSEQLAQVQAAARQTDDVKKLARSVVRHEMLTLWQANQLLAGRSVFLVGKYKLLDLLGSGGMGRVFLAEHTTMGRSVALKIIAKHLAQDPVSLKQFLTEARAIAALDHPNIVHPYSVDSEGDRYYMVMEYVEGRDLQRTVEADGPLEFDQAADYVRQTADGLAHAHGREMIHCDIKPANLLVNGQEVVKILDMGMARLTGRGRGGASEKDEHLLGTVDYLAPEQALDSPDLDHRVDIYSLGCTFYFLLTGRPPFPDGTLHERILKHQTESPRPIRELRPDAPEDLIEICARMMAKSPDDRYTSAEEIGRMLADREPVLEMAEPAEAIVEPESPVDVAGIAAETPAKSSARGKTAGASGALARMRGAFAEHPRMWLFAGLGGVASLVLLVGLILVLTGPGEDPDEKPGVQTASAENRPSRESAQEEPTEPEADDEWPDLPDLGNLRDFDPQAIPEAAPGAPGKSGEASPPGKPKKQEPGAEKQEPKKPTSEEPKTEKPAEPPQPEPATAEAKPPEKPKPPEPAPEPKEPKPTEPEKAKPEKKEPEKPKPQDPLRELAEAIDIPELGTGLGGPEAAPFTIGKIHTEADVEW